MCDLVNRIQDDSQASWKVIPNQLVHRRRHEILALLEKCNDATNMLNHKNLPLSKKMFYIVGASQKFTRLLNPNAT